ncbi:MAG: hypothetical protein ACYYKD_11455 [Rhodospirillales bacterium]
MALAVSALAAAALAATLAAPQAQAADNIRLSAVVLGPLNPGSALRVRFLNDSDENLLIKQRFEAALTGHGFQMDPEAALVLTFETREDAGSYADAGEGSIIEFKAQSGGGGGNADATTMVNVFNSQRGGLLNRGDRPGVSVTSRSTYRLDVSVDDRASGRRVWEGWSTAALDHNGPAAAIAAMVPALAAHVGKSASQAPVPPQ